jgi:pimeloyl-ACP methyl ester carboxylesterase
MAKNGLAGVGTDGVAAVASCSKPISSLYGENDPFIRLEQLGRLTYKNLWLRNPILLKVGHAPYWSHPAEFNRYLGDFLTGVDAFWPGKLGQYDWQFRAFHLFISICAYDAGST